jgi:hypothetical protein
MTFILQWRDAAGDLAWVSRRLGPGFRLSAKRENAFEFLGKADALVVACKFKGYELEVLEVRP